MTQSHFRLYLDECEFISFFPFQRKKIEERKEQKMKERDRQCRFQPFQMKEKTDGKKNKRKKERKKMSMLRLSGCNVSALK
jgi:hypothetical protein